MATTRLPALARRGTTPTPPVRGTGFAATTRSQSAEARELSATAAELGHRFASLSLGAPVQAKLAVSEPGDRHEREADAVAEQIASARTTAAAAPAPAPTITPVSAEAPAERAPEEPTVEREAQPAEKAVAPPSPPSPSAPSAPPDGGDAPADDTAGEDAEHPLEAELAQRRSAGHALPATTRAFFESRLGFDFGHVRLHTDTDAARLNARLGAVAFTHGADVYFSPGSYDASSHEGLKLLAHELTHVVQQHGGHSTPTGMVHRSIISGEAAGNKMQQALLTANPDLIVEAPIPGGTREAGKDKTKLGWADLYTSSDTGNVIWVRGRGNATGGIDYESVKPMKKTKTAKGKPGHNPTFVSASTPFKGDFPSTFKVADIKQVWAGPSFLSKLGEGLFQVDAYKDGLPEFADQAIKDGKASVHPTGAYYDDLVIPPGIDYANFDAEIKNTTPSAQAVILGDRRVWMHHAKKNGLYLVFDLPHPYEETDYRTALENAWAPLEPVRKKLTTPQQAGGKIDQKRKTTRPQRRRKLQRKVDWSAEGKAWEEQRKDWDKKYAKPFLKSKEGKVLADKVKIDSELGIGWTKSITAAGTSLKYNQIDLWSGVSGQLLGALRFKLGPVFDKVIEFIDWARGKLQGFLDKVRALKEKGSGWVRTVVKVLIEGVKIAFKETVSLLFDMYRDCINGILSAVISEFMGELSQKLIDWLQKTHDGFVQWVVSVYKDFEDTYKKYQDLIDTVLDIVNIVQEVAGYEKYIRLALQAFSCLDPPAFGCLWGLVAQFAIDDIIDLAVDTDLFHDRIIKPLARKLLKPFLDEPFKKLIFKTMDAVGLGDWAQKVKACHPDPKDIDIERVVQAMPAGVSVDSPEFKKKKAEWNQKMMQKYMPELLQKFSKQGKPATEEDIKRLLESMNKKKPDVDKLKNALDKSTGSDGKIDVDDARERIDPSPQLNLPPDLVIEKRLPDEPSKSKPRVEGTEQGPALKIPF